MSLSVDYVLTISWQELQTVRVWVAREVQGNFIGLRDLTCLTVDLVRRAVFVLVDEVPDARIELGLDHILVVQENERLYFVNLSFKYRYN